MKKILSICLALAVLFVFTACTTDTADKSSTNAGSPSSTTTSTQSSDNVSSNASSDSSSATSEPTSSDVSSTSSEPTSSTSSKPTSSTTSKPTSSKPAVQTCNHTYSVANCTSPSKCTKCGDVKSAALGHKYEAGECVRKVGNTVCGHYDPDYCPKLYFTGDMTNMYEKSDVREITLEYKSSDKNLTGAAKIKVQGSSSLAYDKKNYTITFYKDNTFDKKMKVDFGWGSQSKYCLKANWVDKTHCRNLVSAKLATQFQDKYGLLQNAPKNGLVDGYPIEIYINGKFHGLYTLNIPKDTWTFNMDEDNPNHIVVCGDGWQSSNWFQADPNFDEWEVEVGEENDETLAKLTRLFRFIRESSDEEFVRDFDQYLNLDATLNYYVMMDLAYMRDNRGKNMLLITYDGKVWYTGLYDMDTSWGVLWDGLDLEPYDRRTLSFSSSVLWTRMEKLFGKQLADRYFELRSGILSTKNIMNTFNSFYNSIPKEVIQREKAKWGNIPGYDLTQIAEYLDAITPQLDKKYNSFK